MYSGIDRADIAKQSSVLKQFLMYEALSVKFRVEHLLAASRYLKKSRSFTAHLPNLTNTNNVGAHCDMV